MQATTTKKGRSDTMPWDAAYQQANKKQYTRNKQASNKKRKNDAMHDVYG